MEQRDRPVMNVGITLIILIFMNICLLTFSVMSLQNAVADKKLTEKTANYTTAYYNAVNEMEVQWKEADILLSKIADSASNKKEFYEKLQDAVQGSRSSYSIKKKQNDYYLICSTSVSEHQRLCGMAKIIWDARDGKYLTEQKSYVNDSGSWEADEKVEVYK